MTVCVGYAQHFTCLQNNLIQLHFCMQQHAIKYNFVIMASTSGSPLVLWALHSPLYCYYISILWYCWTSLMHHFFFCCISVSLTSVKALEEQYFIQTEESWVTLAFTLGNAHSFWLITAQEQGRSQSAGFMVNYTIHWMIDGRRKDFFSPFYSICVRWKLTLDQVKHS